MQIKAYFFTYLLVDCVDDCTLDTDGESMPKEVCPNSQDHSEHLGCRHQKTDQITSPGGGILVLHEVQQQSVITMKYV